MTESQHAVLEALRRLTLDGWPATTREIGSEVGLKSPSSTHWHLLRLKRLGLVERHPRNPRGGWLPRPLDADRSA